MRLFIAINFDYETHSQLLELRDAVRSDSQRGSFVLDDNLHLTLVFLGECDMKQAEAVKKVMSEVTFDPIGLFIDKLGRFRRDGSDIWWAGISTSTTLLELQRCLSDKLKQAGFLIDNRKYTPHITLGRKVYTNMAPKQLDPFGQLILGIDLMKSERIDGILTYTSVFYKNCQIQKE